MSSDSRDFHDALTVREAMDRVGLTLFPDHWTGKEYLDHWRLGLSKWPPTKLRGMQAVRELLRLVWAKKLAVEVELAPGEFGAPLFEVRHFMGRDSMCAGSEEVYLPCRLRFLPAFSASTARAGRTGYEYAPIVVRILTYLDRHGTGQTPDEITHTIRAEIEAEGAKAPSYPRLQPYVSALLAYRSTSEQKFSD